MEIDIKVWFKFAYLDDVLFMLERHHSNVKWGYITSNSKIATSLGFQEDEYYGYFLPIKDIAHTRGFESNVYCKFKGFEFFVHSYNVCNDKLFCISPESYEAAKFFGFSDGSMRYEMPNLDVPLSDLDEIYRKRRKLDKFIFDVDPIKPIYKDGKWLIEPDENGVYVINIKYLLTN